MDVEQYLRRIEYDGPRQSPSAEVPRPRGIESEFAPDFHPASFAHYFFSCTSTLAMVFSQSSFNMAEVAPVLSREMVNVSMPDGS